MKNLKYSKIFSVNWKAERAKQNLSSFIGYTKEDYVFNWHHTFVCNKIQAFVEGKLGKRKMLLCMPPQHGKSEIVSRKLPAWLLGRDPNLRIAGVSYDHDLAKGFNRELQRLMMDTPYSQVFPNTQLNKQNVSTSAKGKYLRNAKIFEIVGHQGSYRCVGMGGGLAGNPVDFLIIDDPVKGHKQAASPKDQVSNIEWYISVGERRCHNDSKILLCTTRWDVNDLAGWLLATEPDEWVVINIEGIREDMTEAEDPRKKGEALWESRHSAETILKVKRTRPKFFYSLYQQRPQPPTELLIMAHAEPLRDMPDLYEKVIGVDFGYSNSPTAAALVEIDRKRRRIYVRELCYKPKLFNEDVAKILKAEGRLICYCDPEGSQNIGELKKLGVIAKPAKKFAGSVLTQILLLQSYEIYYIGRNFEKERNSWQWQMGIDGNPINQEIDRDNHLFKAVMYALYTHTVTGKKESNMAMA